MGVISNIKEHGLKYFTPRRIYAYLRSKLFRLIGYRINQEDIILLSEAVMYKKLVCSQCHEKSECVVCGCPVHDLFAAMDVGCSDGRFPAFAETRDWRFIIKCIFRGRFKKAYSYWKVESWQEGWKKYKERNGIYFINMQK